MLQTLGILMLAAIAALTVITVCAIIFEGIIVVVDLLILLYRLWRDNK